MAGFPALLIQWIYQWCPNSGSNELHKVDMDFLLQRWVISTKLWTITSF